MTEKVEIRNLPKEDTADHSEIRQVHHRRTTNLLFYSELIETINGITKNHGKDKSQAKIIANGLDDLYFALGNLKAMKAFILKYGHEKARELYNLFETELEEKVTELEDKYLNGEKTYSLRERIRIGFSVSRKLASRNLSGGQKERLLSLAGYSQENAINFAKKIGVCSALSAGLGVIYSTTGAITFAENFANPVFKDLDIKESAAILGLSYLAHYGGALLSSIQNIRLLKNQRIQNSPSLAATSSFYILDKIISDKEKKLIFRDGVTVLISAGIIAPFREPAVIAGAMSSNEALSGFAMTNLAFGGLNLLQVAGAETFLRKFGKEKNNT